MNRYDLAGRNAIITGGAGGIGRALAGAMLEAGAQVTLWDANSEGLEAARAALPQAAIRVVDITDQAAVEAAAALPAQIDILVNNAGVLGDVAPIWDSDPQRFRRVIDVNLVGAYLVTRAVVRRMRMQATRPRHRRPLGGHIVNVASIQGKEGMALGGAYSAAKAALIALTKTVAKETARDGIVVTCITPAAAETAMAREITPERRADITSRIPMGRFVALDEIARMVLWLCSDECSFSTGGIFDLSGGRATY
jgi:3-oxoacyl-[acyl-carrier protein] reductase